MTMTSQQLGKYRILDTIGKGGFATVYRAHDTDLDRDVALKVLDPLLTRDPAWVQRFRLEARTVARLRHPRIVAIHEVGQAEGMLFLAMDLIAGGNLADRLTRAGAQPWDQVVRLVGEIAEALDYAHSQGVLHRDLKPANVLLDPHAGSVLTDFGLAKLVADNSLSTSLSTSGGVLGTPAYIAPEVWEGQPTTTQTDVYALACICYELVTGRQLFTGATPFQILRAIHRGPQFPDSWPADTPAGLVDVLVAALAADPARRYPTAGDLAAAVRALSIDLLAEPYAALEAMLEDGQWHQALDLADRIRAQDANYRDVAVLGQRAQARLAQAARQQQAATWQEAAMQAQDEGDWEGVELAVGQWLALLPGDEQALALLAQVEAARQQLFQTSGVSTMQMDDAESIRTDLEDETVPSFLAAKDAPNDEQAMKAPNDIATLQDDVELLSMPLSVSVLASSLVDNPWASPQLAEPLPADPDALAEERVETTEPARSGQIAPGAKRKLLMILILGATILVVVVALGMVFQ